MKRFAVGLCSCVWVLGGCGGSAPEVGNAAECAGGRCDGGSTANVGSDAECAGNECDGGSTPDVRDETPCAGVTCDTPPVNFCVDATTLRTYVGNGTCADGQCSYAHTDAHCQSGCENGACLGDDPCNGVTCNSPPAAICTDANTLRSFSASGTCSAGTCSYSSTTSTCDHGCESGKCTGDPCAGVACNQPPEPSCVNATTLRSSSATGTCNAGACTYAHTDQTCSTCTNGTCIPVSQCPTPTTPPPFVPTVPTRTGISSPNASATAVYMSARSEAALRSAGAFSATTESVLKRIHNYAQAPSFGVDMLLFAEDPSRWSTFTATEQAVFPKLWQMLQIATPSDLTQPGPFPTFASLIQRHDQMTPLRLDVNARTQISMLPSVHQPVADHVVKTAGAPAGTISFAEVTTALANYANYPSSEYFYFGPILRAIEALAVTPATFPNLEIVGTIDQTQTIGVGNAAVTIARTRSTAACAAAYSGNTTIASSVTVSLTVPAGTTLVWVPLTTSTGLNSNVLSNQYVFTSNANTLTSAGTPGNPWDVALAEAWQGGQRVAQGVVRLPNSESVWALRYAIVQQGQFVCRPTDQEASDTHDLQSYIVLPPGRYTVPAGSYGSATLDLYGQNLLKLSILTQEFWAAPATSTPDYSVCWALTSLGPTNDVTCASGPGPGFRLVNATGGVYFDEVSYGVCPSGGHNVITLTEASRQ